MSPLAAFMLSTAMRVGPGNIVGVAGAISLGGPGALFWIWVSALFGMASSFVEAMLAQIFKEKGRDEFVGGLPYYGQKLLGGRHWIGIVRSVFFIAYAMLSISIQTFHVFTATGTAVGAITGTPAERSSTLYYIIAIILIIGIAVAVFGGIKRGLLSNEAGQGTITMSAVVAEQDHPCEQGVVQSIGVFLDTIVICTLSSFVVCSASIWNTDAALWETIKTSKTDVFLESLKVMIPEAAMDGELC